MAGILDLLTGGSRDPAVAAFLSADRGLLNRLGAYMQAKEAAPIIEQRKQILQEAYTPAQPERKEIDAQAPNLLDTAMSAAKPMPQMANSPVPMPRVNAASYKAMTSPAPLPSTTERVISGKPASFDVDTAVARLRSIGDMNTADSLLSGEYKQALAGARAAGKGEKWYGNPRLVRGTDGKMYNQLLSDQGNAKLVPVDGDLTGELKQMDLDGRKVWVNAYTGQPVSSFNVTPTAYQSWQMDDNAQAGQALAVEQAKVTGRLGAEKAADYADKGDKASDALNELNALTGALGKLSSPLYTKYQNVAGFFGEGDPEYQAALGEVDRAAGRMLAYVERLPGAATDGDRDIFMASAGVLRDQNLPVARRIAAAEAAKASFRRLVEKYGQGAPAPAARPTPGKAPAAKMSAQEQLRAIDQARAAVARGADKAAVNKRLREAGINFQVK